jgi:hypothetical protein
MPGVRTGERTAVNGRRWAGETAQEEGRSESTNTRNRGASQRSVKNGCSSKCCVREGASVAMHWQRVEARQLYRRLQEEEGNSGRKES